MFNTSFFARLVLIGVFYLFRKQQFPVFLVWLGKISYALYLVHMMVMGALAPLNLSGFAFTAITICFSVGVAYLVHRFIGTPAIRAGRRRRH